MKKLTLAFSLLFIFSLSISSVLAVEVTEDNKYITIETEMYTVKWNKPAQMGYMQAFLPDSDESLIGEAGRAFYHSAKYQGGWTDWGALKDWEIVSEEVGKVVIKYTSNDGKAKEYTVLATYYDTANWIKHEFTVTNVGGGTVNAFESDHEPMFEANVPAEAKAWNSPIPHVAYWTKEGYAALYSETGKARKHSWKGSFRIALTHDGENEKLNKGDTSKSIVNYIAFGEGGEDEAHALAEKVTQPPPPAQAVAGDKLSITWGYLKSSF